LLAPRGLAAKPQGRIVLLREYDFTIITRGDLPEGENTKALSTYENLMVADGGEILKREEWGVKRLAYPIKKVFRGHYVNYDFIGTPENMAEMERLMRIDDNVLRHLTVRIDEEAQGITDIEARKAEIAKIEQEAREAEQKRRRE
jgi:small subunit ribosomal protein S6